MIHASLIDKQLTQWMLLAPDPNLAYNQSNNEKRNKWHVWNLFEVIFYWACVERSGSCSLYPVQENSRD